MQYLSRFVPWKVEEILSEKDLEIHLAQKSLIVLLLFF